MQCVWLSDDVVCVHPRTAHLEVMLWSVEASVQGHIFPRGIICSIRSDQDRFTKVVSLYDDISSISRICGCL